MDGARICLDQPDLAAEKSTSVTTGLLKYRGGTGHVG